jgi:CRP/FNR family transcriptional regulator, anaerobic regulatory protein
MRGAAKLTAMMASNVRRIRPGAMLIAPNIDDDFIYRVRSGWLAQSHTMADGRHHYIHLFLTGDLFRVSALFSPEQSDCVTAITEVMIDSVHRHELLHAVLRDPDVSARCLWEMRQHEQRLERSVVSLGQRTAKERLCSFLLELRARLQSAGCVAAGTWRFQMPLTQAQLGTHLGLTSVHINRVLRELRALGVLQIGRGQVSVLDLNALRSHANL